jgi:hypothetical protein
MTDKKVTIPSSLLTADENYSGVNLAYWSLKAAYLELEGIQQSLRGEKNYTLSDKVRDVMEVLDRGYSYRLGNIKGSNQ